MICNNCGKEMNDHGICNYCGYDSQLSDQLAAREFNANMVKLNKTEIIKIKDSNGMAKAGFVFGIFSIIPVFWILSFIFSIVGLTKVKYCRSGRVLSILGLIECMIVIYIWVTILSSI